MWIAFYTLFYILSLEFPQLVLASVAVALVLTIHSFFSAKRAYIHATALLLFLLNYLFDSALFFRFFPLTISLVFLAIFVTYELKDRNIVLLFYRKIFKNEPTESLKNFLHSSQKFWILVLFLNSSIHTALLFSSLFLWSIYSLFGWYLLFGFALMLNIIYGELFVVKRFKKSCL